MYRGEMMMDRKLINQWREERNAMIETLNVDEFKKFVKKWQKYGLYERYMAFLSEEIIKLTLCEMAWGLESVSEDTKKKAIEWCNENGYGGLYERHRRLEN